MTKCTAFLTACALLSAFNVIYVRSLTIGPRWDHVHFQKVPANAFKGGVDESREPLYVCKTTLIHNTGFISLTGVVEKKKCYTTWDGRAYDESDYQILIHDDNLSWLKIKEGDSIPGNAVVGGLTKYGQPIYVGLIYSDGTTKIGRVESSPNSIYVHDYTLEAVYERDFEILIFE